MIILNTQSFLKRVIKNHMQDYDFVILNKNKDLVTSLSLYRNSNKTKIRFDLSKVYWLKQLDKIL